jgi:hypothetical protein
MVEYFFMLAVFLLFPGMALAATGEQVVSQQVIIPSFDIWQHSNGVWQDTDACGELDYYGWEGKTYSKAFTLPESEWQGKYKLTRAEVTYPFTQEQFNNSGRLEDWKYFKSKYIRKTPNNYSVAKAGENLDEGKVTAQWKFDLAPKSLNLKDPTVREQLGMDEKDFSNLAQGWRWYLPVLITWYGMPQAPQDNLDVVITSYPEEVRQGKAITVTGELTSNSETPITTVVSWSVNGKKVFEGLVTVDKTRELNLPLSMPAGDTTVKVEVNPYRNQPASEITWEDNSDSITVKLAVAPRPGNGQLILTAMSQAGEDLYGEYHPSEPRPAGTAKWTDTVTATLKPPAPNPPKGKLKSWSITSAKLTYPKRHPRFVFGNPLPPEGTTTVNMTTGGHTSTVSFREDWALDGTGIFSQIQDRLVAETPKHYPISATYSIHYTYEYKIRHRSCHTRSDGSRSCHTWYETKTGSGTTGGTATAQLLVNGTGVGSYAS